MKIETFKCATGAGWAIQVDGMMDSHIPYSQTENEAYMRALIAYPGKPVLTCADKGHYAYESKTTMKKPFYSVIAQTLDARIRCCEEQGNDDWFIKHSEAIEDLVKKHCPSGSGFDSGTKLDFDASKPNRLVFNTSFHHMDDNGHYCGWSEHQVIVIGSLAYSFEIRVTGRDMRDIKGYIGETFHHIGTIEVDPWAKTA